MLEATGKKYLNIYLIELNKLCHRSIGMDNLISLDETYRIIEKIKERIPKEYVFRDCGDFNNKEMLRDVFQGAMPSFVNGAYLFTEYSKNCGACLLDKLSDFNTDFSFDSEHSGIISIVNKEITMKILLDFYEEDGHRIDVEFFKKS